MKTVLKKNTTPAEALAELKIVKKRLLDILESTNDAFVSLDRDWHFTYLNRHAERIEGKSRNEVIGKKLWEVFPGILRSPFYTRLKEAMETGKSSEVEMLAESDGRWYEIKIFPTSEGVSTYYRDITDRKQFDQRKDEFIRLASHELKTPITSLRLYAELLQSSIPEGELRQYTDKIVDQADKLDGLVSELLDLSRIQVGKMSFKYRSCNLVQLASDVVAAVQKTTPSHHIECQIRAREAWVRGDKLRLQQVLTNLINNAVKYSPDQDRIIFALWRDRKQVHISVQDFGIGIPEGYHDKIFDRFYQVPHTDSESFPGFGIGLYISKVIMEKHGGVLTVQSKVGQGSTFTVSLPLKPKSAK